MYKIANLDIESGRKPKGYNQWSGLSECERVIRAFVCPRCNNELKAPGHKARKNGLSIYCTDCKKEYYFLRDLKVLYNITIEEYNVLFKNSCGTCNICDKKCSRGKRLNLDHDHKTGKVRGLLCWNCNKGLGAFRDDLKLLRKAVDYLEQ